MGQVAPVHPQAQLCCRPAAPMGWRGELDDAHRQGVEHQRPAGHLTARAARSAIRPAELGEGAATHRRRRP